jgi:hypothetical protein
MTGWGSMLSFQMRGGREAAVAAAARVRLFIRATSLGGPHSLIEHRASIEAPTPKLRKTCCVPQLVLNTPMISSLISSKRCPETKVDGAAAYGLFTCARPWYVCVIGRGPGR